MTGEVFVGSAREYIDNRVVIEKDCWTRKRIFKNCDIVDTYYALMPSGEIDDFAEEAFLRPMIKLKYVPEDYRPGDCFKISTSDTIWEYLGNSLGISKNYLGPYDDREIKGLIKSMNKSEGAAQ